MVPEHILYANISSHAVRLYAVLGRYADKDTHDCYPARKTLAKKMHVSLTTFRRALAELEKLGAIEKTPRYNQRGRTSSYYVLPWLGSRVASTKNGYGSRVVRTTGEPGVKVTGEPAELEPVVNENQKSFLNSEPGGFGKRTQDQKQNRIEDGTQFLRGYLQKHNLRPREVQEPSEPQDALEPMLVEEVA
jgi:hypothetical protein